jgi:hypothetical protein
MFMDVLLDVFQGNFGIFHRRDLVGQVGLVTAEADGGASSGFQEYATDMCAGIH